MSPARSDYNMTVVRYLCCYTIWKWLIQFNKAHVLCTLLINNQCYAFSDNWKCLSVEMWKLQIVKQFWSFIRGVYLSIIGSEIEQEACSYKHWACFHALLAYVQVNLVLKNVNSDPSPTPVLALICLNQMMLLLVVLVIKEQYLHL